MMEESAASVMFKIASVALIVSFVISISRPDESINCKRNRLLLDDSFYGKVTKKTLNGVGNYETIILNNGQVFCWQDSSLSSDSYLIYDSIQIGDFIVKKENELIIRVDRDDSLFVLDVKLPCTAVTDPAK